MRTLAVPYAAPMLENIIADALSTLRISSPSSLSPSLFLFVSSD